MARHLQLDLKTFDISSQNSALSLSMTSVAFIYDVPLQNVTQENLSSLIRSKQLWLLPRGLCRLDVRIQLGECDIGVGERADFFELVANTICQSFLGLVVEILDIQYHQENNIPNFYFSIEQPDMSSALLSPPHAHTAQIKGLECILRFDSTSRLTASAKEQEQVPSQMRMSPMAASPSYHTLRASDVVDLWENASRLVEAALCITFGTRKRIEGMKVIELENGPSMLELAPAIWNSHYLKSVINHTKNFTVISNILASSLKGQSPDLRRKGAGLLQGNIVEGNDNPGRGLEQQTKQLESSIQRRLWNLLQDTIEPTIGTSNITRKSVPPKVGSDHQEYEMGRVMVDEATVDRCGLLNDLHCPYGNLLQPEGHDYDGTSYDSDMEIALSQVYDPAFSSQDSRLLEAPEFQSEVESLYYETGMYGDQFPETDSQYAESNISYAMQDYMYDNDDIYGHNYDYTNHMGQTSSGHELTEIFDYWEKQEAHRGAIEESVYELDADEEDSLPVRFDTL
ncbi:hypothetical protein FHL15_001718 [Xylaria flabelliformis]|uniref:Uncharacterized protein n=1 Tax=Xylaria flabelliformis TaxID=2512241 RepID=A0A553IB60_9PEZI|nr:hypothetical protein FHL15_001718 [Xylaria flabelliformis]